MAGLHDEVTGRRGSHKRTRAAIIEALDRGIPLKVAIVELSQGQRAHEAHAEMKALGIPDLGPVDRMRGIGRGTREMGIASDVNELCGRCGDGRAAVSWDGDVRLCVMSRFLPSAGNVRTTPLGDILAGPIWRGLLTQVPRPRRGAPPCTPITECPPASDGNDCPPASTECEGNALLLPTIRPIPLRAGGR
ncbi:SPASM domain-containing protein [Spongiactinospora rosea]|uniref:SPASM domain-containing protein n=1 Tax=Spongiactinospora rosea TaxID=2248750 RepID=UPI001314CA02|nr:SPASM domain-containing protein [Spongiactinospora rosea]